MGQLSRAVPAVGRLTSYRRSNLGRDALVAVSTWALVAPQALAYASLADVPVQVGLYSMMPALIIYALFGRSSRVIVGVSATTAALVPLTVASVTSSDASDYLTMTVALTFAVGVLYLALGLLRMGWVANFLSGPVVAGFISGFGITLLIGQIPKLLGFHVDENGAFRQLWDILQHLDETSVTTLVIGVLAVTALFGIERVMPRLPATIVVVVVAVLATRIFSLSDHGVSVVGSVPRGLPDLGFPSVGIDKFVTLLGAGIAIVIVGFSEALGAAQAMARKYGEELDVNSELVANGLANIGSGFCSGIVVNGSLSKTAANDAAGATNQMSSLLAGGLMLITMLFLTGLFEDLPNAVLGAIVLHAAVSLIDVAELSRVARISRIDFAAASAALLGTVVANILVGMLMGVALSLLLLIHRASHLQVHELGRAPDGRQFGALDTHPEYTDVPGILVLRTYGGLFFAPSAEFVAKVDDLVHRADGAIFVLLDLGAVPYIDVTGADALGLLMQHCEAQHLELHIAEVRRDVFAVLERSASPLLSNPARVHDSVDTAVARLSSAT